MELATKSPRWPANAGWAQLCPCPPTETEDEEEEEVPTYQVLQQHCLVRDLRCSSETPTSKRQEERQPCGRSRIQPQYLGAPFLQGTGPHSGRREASSKPRVWGWKDVQGRCWQGSLPSPVPQFPHLIKHSSCPSSCARLSMPDTPPAPSVPSLLVLPPSAGRALPPFSGRSTNPTASGELSPQQCAQQPGDVVRGLDHDDGLGEELRDIQLHRTQNQYP